MPPQQHPWLDGREDRDLRVEGMRSGLTGRELAIRCSSAKREAGDWIERVSDMRHSISSALKLTRKEGVHISRPGWV